MNGPAPVERWFAGPARKEPERGVHRSVRARGRGVRGRLADRNGNPGPSVRAGTADEIPGQAAVRRRRVPGSGHRPRSVRAQGASTAAASIATRTLLSRASAK
ncbi:hypothetical protein GCM10010421_41230 [Streptomyces glaucus]|uniref:Secreted protein n=1 Tax=Streptomyces glaucus TaxID=284029 RepID=A0ABN3K0Z0_9ACTN